MRTDDVATRRTDAAWQALCRSQAIIEFDTDGLILWANDLFLTVMGYGLDELVGRHHRMLCAPDVAQSPDYAAFWRNLAAGQFHSGEYRRHARDGSTVYLQATYNPVFDAEGRLDRILKIATDITASQRHRAELEAISAAMHRSALVIEFALDGTILDANDNFLKTMGYALEEVVGRHDRIFCDPDYARSAHYADLWRRLATGNFDNSAYSRRARDGSEIWLQASYSPVFDPEGKPFKIVQFAGDVTRDKHRAAESEGRTIAIDRSQAVVEFDLTGIIVEANANFLSLFGYSREELVGQHHRLLCDR